jgi:hypothetical protein
MHHDFLVDNRTKAVKKQFTGDMFFVDARVGVIQIIDRRTSDIVYQKFGELRCNIDNNECISMYHLVSDKQVVQAFNLCLELNKGNKNDAIFT